MQTTPELLPNEQLFTIGTSATTVLDKRFSQRKELVITNVSTGGQIITINVGVDANTDYVGIILYQGGTYSHFIDPVYKPTNERISIRSTLAGASVSVHEVMLT